MNGHWQDPYEHEETSARQELAAMEQWLQRGNREQRLINVGLVGFNLGLAVYQLSCYLARDGWGYLVGALIHLATGAYTLWQYVRLSRTEETPCQRP